MLVDTRTLFATEAARNSDGILGDVVDLGSDTNRDIGDGKPLYVHIVHTADSTGGTGSNYIDLQLRSSANTNLTSSHTIHTSIRFNDSIKRVGDVDTMVIPPGTRFKRYMGLYADETGSASIEATAFLSCQPFTYGVSYPDAEN